MKTKLIAHHRLIDEQLADLREKVGEDDSREIRTRFSAFEKNLLSHMDWEEMHLLPRYEDKHPKEAEKIHRDHREIRAILGRMGIEIDLHLLRDEAFHRFAEMLTAHARREDQFYAWSDEVFSESERESLWKHFRRLVD
jgi:hypothetical protein